MPGSNRRPPACKAVTAFLPVGSRSFEKPLVMRVREDTRQDSLRMAMRIAFETFRRGVGVRTSSVQPLPRPRSPCSPWSARRQRPLSGFQNARRWYRCSAAGRGCLAASARGKVDGGPLVCVALPLSATTSEQPTPSPARPYWIHRVPCPIGRGEDRTRFLAMEGDPNPLPLPPSSIYLDHSTKENVTVKKILAARRRAV